MWNVKPMPPSWIEVATQEVMMGSNWNSWYWLSKISKCWTILRLSTTTDRCRKQRPEIHWCFRFSCVPQKRLTFCFKRAARRSGSGRRSEAKEAEKRELTSGTNLLPVCAQLLTLPQSYVTQIMLHYVRFLQEEQQSQNSYRNFVWKSAKRFFEVRSVVKRWSPIHSS